MPSPATHAPASDSTPSPSTCASALQRGLTAGKIADVRRLIEQLGELAPPAAAGDAPAVRQADAAQREALGQLRDWYRDWATTLRTLFPTHVQIRLGLTRRRRADTEGEAAPPAEAATAEPA